MAEETSQAQAKQNLINYLRRLQDRKNELIAKQENGGALKQAETSGVSESDDDEDYYDDNVNFEDKYIDSEYLV